VLNPTLQTARYQWPVHRIGPAFIPAEALDKPINLLVYRCHDDQVAFERVNDLTLRFLALAENSAVHPVAPFCMNWPKPRGSARLSRSLRPAVRC